MKGAIESNRKQVDTISYLVSKIQSLWNRSFANHMTAESQETFSSDLETIRQKCKEGDYVVAAAIAHQYYDISATRDEFAEADENGIGFTYHEMAGKFEYLEKLIRKKGGLPPMNPRTSLEDLAIVCPDTPEYIGV